LPFCQHARGFHKRAQLKAIAIIVRQFTNLLFANQLSHKNLTAVYSPWGIKSPITVPVIHAQNRCITDSRRSVQNSLNPIPTVDEAEIRNKTHSVFITSETPRSLNPLRH